MPVPIIRSQIPSQNISSTTNILMVAGFSAVGDNGAGAIYTSTGAGSSGPMAIQDSTGTWFQLVLTGPTNVGWFGADKTGATDCSTAIQKAILFSNELYFPSGIYKFSVVATVNAPLTVKGCGLNSKLVPLGATQPCFIICGNINAKIIIRDVQFVDSGTQTACGMWMTGGSMETHGCYFINLKYGMVANACEWTAHYQATWEACFCNFYATCSYAVTTYDPLGFQANTKGATTAQNPSEHYFQECWGQGNVAGASGNGVWYYEDQGDNPYDLTTNVNFNNCKFFYGSANIIVHNSGMLTLSPTGAVTLRKCWFEGRTGSEPSVVINSVTYPTSIIYLEGCGLNISETTGIAPGNWIYVKKGTHTSDAFGLPQVVIERCNLTGNNPFTFDAGIIATMRDCSMSGQGMADWGTFTIAKAIVPTRGDVAAGGGAATPSTPPMVNIVNGGASLVNLWATGLCYNTIPVSGVNESLCTSMSIVSDGIYGKCLQLTMPQNGGIYGPVFTGANGNVCLCSFGTKNSGGASAHIVFSVYNALTPTVEVNVPNDGVWHYYTIVVYVEGASASAQPLLTHPDATSITLRFTAIQALIFPNLAAAVQFSNSGLYVLAAGDSLTSPSLLPSTVAGLPAASAANQGTRAFVTDATASLTAGIGTIVAGTGSNKVPVVSDGTNWRIG